MSKSWEDIEAIKQLKARYFRLLDTKQWDAWRELFSEDFTGLYEGPHPDVVFSGPDELVEQMRSMLAEVKTVHQGHTPEITLHSPERASGIWSMYDRVDLPGNAFEAWGHYHEDYRKIDGRWRISRLHLTRLAVAPRAL